MPDVPDRRRSWERSGIQKTLDLRDPNHGGHLFPHRYRGKRAGVVITLPAGRRIEGCGELRLVLGARAARELAAALIEHAEYLEAEGLDRDGPPQPGGRR
jgi:hypothetical protein